MADYFDSNTKPDADPMADAFAKISGDADAAAVAENEKRKAYYAALEASNRKRAMESARAKTGGSGILATPITPMEAEALKAAPSLIGADQGPQPDTRPVREAPTPGSQQMDPMAAAKLARLRQVQAEPDYINLSGGSRTVRPARFNAQESNALRSGYTNRILQGRESLKRTTSIHDEAARRYSDQAADMILEEGAAEDAATSAKGKLDEVNKRIELGLADLKKRKIDPDRYWKNEDGSTNWLRKGLGAIASAMGAYASALSGGKIKNFAQQIIDQSVNRDIAAQRANFARKLQTLEIDQKQKAGLWRQWTKAEGDRKAAMKQVAALELGALGQKADGEKARNAFYDLAMDYTAKGVAVAADSRDKITRTSSSRKGVNAGKIARLKALGAGSGGKRLPNDVLKNAAMGAGVAGQLKSYLKGSKGVGYWEDKAGRAMGAVGKGTDASALDAQRKIIAADIVKAISGVAAREDEKKEIRALIPSPGDTPAGRRRKLIALDSWVASKNEAQGKVYSDAGFDSSPLMNNAKRVRASIAGMLRASGKGTGEVK